MYVKDLKKKFLVIKNGGISRWTLIYWHMKKPSKHSLRVLFEAELPIKIFKLHNHTHEIEEHPVKFASPLP